MVVQKLVLRFEGLNAAQAGLAAQGLQQFLSETAPEVGVTLQRDREEAQDMGATLVLLLGAPALVALAKGIAAYLGKRGERPGVLVVERVAADGRVERVRFDGDSADAAKVAQALRGPAPGSS